MPQCSMPTTDRNTPYLQNLFPDVSKIAQSDHSATYDQSKVISSSASKTCFQLKLSCAPDFTFGLMVQWRHAQQEVAGRLLQSWLATRSLSWQVAWEHFVSTSWLHVGALCRYGLHCQTHTKHRHIRHALIPHPSCFQTA